MCFRPQTLFSDPIPIFPPHYKAGSVLLEGSSPWIEIFEVPLSGQLWIAAAAMAAAAYNLFAYLLVGHLGAVGSQVMGNLKTPSIIFVSMLLFGNPCTALQVLGFCVAMFGAYSYNAWGKETEQLLTSAREENSLNYELPGATKMGSAPNGEFGMEEDDLIAGDNKV